MSNAVRQIAPARRRRGAAFCAAPEAHDRRERGVESGRERPPKRARDFRRPAAPEGRSRPDSQPGSSRTVLAQLSADSVSVVAAHLARQRVLAPIATRRIATPHVVLSEGMSHGADQASHPRQAARQAPDASGPRDERDPVRVRARFIGEPTEYVLNQVIDTVLAKDKDFLQWRAEHPDSFVPRNLGKRHNRRPAHAPVRSLSDTTT